MTTAPSVEEVAAALQASRSRLEALALAKPGAIPFARMLARLSHLLSAPPRVVLLGEFNSGKSTLANALIGAEALPTSIHANTRVPVHARFSQRPTLSVEFDDGHREPLTEFVLPQLQEGRVRMLHAGVAIPRLKVFEFIDTPGLQPGGSAGAGAGRADRLALEACRRAHIAIWCTASTQAWKASEAQMWSMVPERLKSRSLLVATRADALNSDRDRSRIEERLQAEARPHFAAVTLAAGAEVEELRANPNAPDHAERWTACGGEAIDRELQALIDRERADRTASVARVLGRIVERIPKNLSGT